MWPGQSFQFIIKTSEARTWPGHWLISTLTQAKLLHGPWHSFNHHGNSEKREDILKGAQNPFYVFSKQR